MFDGSVQENRWPSKGTFVVSLYFSAAGTLLGETGLALWQSPYDSLSVSLQSNNTFVVPSHMLAFQRLLTKSPRPQSSRTARMSD